MNLKEIYLNTLELLDLGYPDEEIISEIPEGYRPQATFDLIKKSSRYTPGVTSGVIERLALLGLPDKEICASLDVEMMVFNMWKEAFPEVKEALKKSREDTDCRVAEALLKLCIGYEEEDLKLFHNKGEVIEHYYLKKYQPSMSAIKLWLETKQKGIWNNPDMIELGLNLSLKAKDLEDVELESIIHKAGLVKKVGPMAELEEALA